VYILPVGRVARQHEVREGIQGVREEDQPPRRREPRHRRSDGGGLLRRPHLETGGGEGQELQGRQGPGGRLRPDVRSAGPDDRDARVQQAHVPARAHRRDPQERPVQDHLAHEEQRGAGAVEQVHEPGQGLRLDQAPRDVPEEGLMRLLFLLLLVAWLAAPAASHAQSPEALKGLARPLVDDGGKREAGVNVLGTTRDPKWLEFLGALRDGNVYARGQGRAAEVVVGGVKSTKGDQDVIDIVTAYDRRPLGTVPISSLTEIAADRRLRIAIKPFLDADEPRPQPPTPDPHTPPGAPIKLAHQAAAP